MANSEQSPTTPVTAPADAGRSPEPAPASVLAQIVDQLPIALTVQDHDGRFILANAAAAANLAIPPGALIGASPGDFLPAAEALDRRQWEINLIRSGQSSTIEEKVAGPAGEQTWLTRHQGLRILDRTL